MFEAVLTAEEAAAQLAERIKRHRDDLLHYAPRALNIRQKSGAITPLALNSAQMWIHHRLEQQLAATGKVRAIVLKGRQQGACLAPDTPVLTADLRWVRIDSLEPGQEVVACDENPGAGRGTGIRRMRTATVEKVWHTRKQSFRVTFDDGRSVICSAEHRWLSMKSNVQPKWRSLKGSTPDGRDGLKVGDKVRSITEHWGEPTLDDAWFGGMIDGEGSLDFRRRTGTDLAISQRAGPVLDRMLAHCALRDYPFCVVSDDGPRKTKFGQQPVHAISISTMRAMFRLMGLSRPVRFIVERWWEGKCMPDNGWREIVSIEPVGELDLVDIQTSCGTFIANGLVSHNSTYIQARFFHRVSLRPGLLALILTHLGDSTDALFGMTKRYYDLCPDELRPKASAANENELSFAELDSGYVVATAGNRKGVGRGRTFQLFHGSEMAFWPDPESIMSGLGQTVPDEIGSEIILESTANGVGNAFHQAWLDAEKGKSDYIAIFVPWYWQPEYRRPVYPGFALEPDEQVYYETYRPRGITLEHMVWRRAKLANELRGDVALFDQEYPAEPLLAFTKVAGTPLIPADLVAAAMRPDLNVEASGPLIMGVDPAEYGDDDSAVVLRRGRRAFGTDTGGKVQRWSKLSPMELVGRIARLADHYKPAAINVDATGLGSGVADRLRELNYPVNRIMFGGKPAREQLYVLKRDEIWGDMLEWLQDAPNQLPNDDVLAGELCAPQYTYDSSRRLKVESKESMRKRGVPSPDSADALALTFATPFADYGPGAANGKDDGWRAVRSRRPVH